MWIRCGEISPGENTGRKFLNARLEPDALLAFCWKNRTLSALTSIGEILMTVGPALDRTGRRNAVDGTVKKSIQTTFVRDAQEGQGCLQQWHQEAHEFRYAAASMFIWPTRTLRGNSQRVRWVTPCRAPCSSTRPSSFTSLSLDWSLASYLALSCVSNSTFRRMNAMAYSWSVDWSANSQLNHSLHQIEWWNGQLLRW